MDYYRYNAFLEQLPWIENLLEERLFMGYSHLNVSIAVKSVDVDFLASKLDIGLGSLQTDLDERGGPTVIGSVSLDGIWVVRDKEQSFVTLIKDVLKIRESDKNLEFLERPVYELLARSYADSLYLVLVFAKLDLDKNLPLIEIIILKPISGRGFMRYLREIENGVIEEVEEELDL